MNQSKQKSFSFSARHGYALAGAAVGVLFFLFLYGARVLDPTNADWILNSGADPSQHYLGWALYRGSDIRLPYLGMSYNTVYPYRTSVLYSDSIPLLALLFRPLAGLLPPVFQYLGWWGLGCFALQGLLAQKIVWTIAGAETRGAGVRLGTVAAAVLALLYPVLTIRMFAHTALAANWLILLGLWLWLCCRGDTGKSCLWWGLAGILCVGIHQYYLPMLGICAVGYALCRLMRGDGPAPALLPVASYCACALAELFVLGAFSGNFADTGSTGWSRGADLLGLIIPGLSQSWEADVYMGAGVVLACAAALAAWLEALIRRRGRIAWRRWLPWIVSACVIMALGLLAAASYSVTVGGVHLVDLPIPGPLLALWQMFSVCARLAWMPGYLMLSLACGALLRYWRAAGLAILAVCIVVQGIWRADALTERYERFHSDTLYSDHSPLQDDAWDQIAQSGNYTHLAFASYEVDNPGFWPLVNFAAKNQWTVNCFYLAHMQYDVLESTLMGQLDNVSADTLYVFLGKDELNHRRLADKLHFYRIDGILVGSVNPLPLPEAEIMPVSMDLAECTVTENGTSTVSAQAIDIVETEMMVSDSWNLYPGRYEVIVRGENLDHCYIQSFYHPIGEDNSQELDILFLYSDPNEIVFQFTAKQLNTDWNVQIHALDDHTVHITSIEVSATS